MIEELQNLANFTSDYFEAIAIIVIGVVTLKYNRRTQERVLQYNAKIKTYETMSNEVADIRDMLIGVIIANDKVLEELAIAGDTSQDPEQTFEEKKKALDKHFDNIKDLLDQVDEARYKVRHLLEILETNAFTSEEIEPAIKSLRIEFREINDNLSAVHDKLIHFDINNATVEIFRDLQNDTQKSNDELIEFNLLLDDLSVILQNNLTSEIFDHKRKHRNIDPPRRVLTENGIDDQRIKQL